ncbi:MAG: selenocysteine-specific translation elongation factor [Planctomycetota bacterium]
MDYILLGTAGHVDHGKSTLIKALSGIDPDRLKEEKEREMTIDIGFANFILPSGRCAQVIDVPGHERFIKNMLTGINTIDLVLFLVDANEGIKPQTQEHFDILKLLALKIGIIVLSKVDLVDNERIEEVTKEVKEFVKDSFMEKSPIIKVSAITGSGITELIQAIDDLSPGIPQRSKDLPVRLPIDRVFTMSGSGTVITGTLISGILKVDDHLVILPQKKDVRIRQIQSHRGKATQAVAGQRVGINLAGVKKEELIRGNTLSARGYVEPTNIFDAGIEIMPNSLYPLKNNTRVRLHIGTGEFLGRIILLDKDRLEPGQHGVIQFKSESPLVIVKDDRFIVRLYAPMVLIGGGKITDAHPVKHKRFQSEVVQQLESMESATSEESIIQVLMNAGLNTLDSKIIADKVNLPLYEIETTLKKLDERGEIITIASKPVRSDATIRSVPYPKASGRIMHIHNFNLLKDSIIQTLNDLYPKQPLRLNIPLKEIKQFLDKIPAGKEFLDMALGELAKDNVIQLTGNSIRLSQYSIQLTAKQEQLRQRIENIYLDNLFNPPRLENIAQTLNIKLKPAEEIINILKEMEFLVDLPEEIIMHKKAIDKVTKILNDYFKEHENIRPGEFTKLLNTSRKYAIPLLEYLDSIKITKRVGDVRVLS